MALSTDPYQAEVALRRARATPPQQWETVRTVPPPVLEGVLPACEQARERLLREIREHARQVEPADPVQKKLDRIISQNAEIIELLRR